jgi:MraZ protein
LNFRGTFEHSLDAKHRLTVPARYRAALAGGVIVANWPETRPGTPRAVALWVPEEFDAYTAAALAGLNPLLPEARELNRFFSNNSWESELDSAYRVIIPPGAITYASLGKDVTVTGSGTHLEVWDRAAYAPYNEDLMARFPELVAGVEHTS